MSTNIRIIPNLMHVKLEDGSYAIILPINTVNEVYYDVKNKKTVKDILDEKVDKVNPIFTKGSQTIIEDSVAIYEDLASLNLLNSSPQSGALKIKFPKYYTNSSISIVVSGFSLATSSAWKVTANGYANLATKTWDFCSFAMEGMGPFRNVRFADDGTNLCLLIGDTDTTWAKSMFIVNTLIVGNNGLEGWDNGYELSLLKSSATLSHVTPCQLVSSSKIDIRKYAITISSEYTAIPFVNKNDANVTIDKFELAYDELEVYVNGMKLIEGIHYTITQNIDGYSFIEPSGEYTFSGTSTEPLIFEFVVTKNAKPQ